MFEKWFHKFANKKGYFKISQLKVGGMCGCCGKAMPNLIWVDYRNGDNWADIGICEQCKDGGDNIIRQVTYGDNTHFIFTNKKKHDFMAELGKVTYTKKS